MAAEMITKLTRGVRNKPTLKCAWFTVNTPTLAKVRLAGDGGDQGVDETVEEALDEEAESCADDDSDGKVNNVAAHQEVLETFEHGRGSFSD